ncbi:MAG: DUF4239 domain-containing protein [Alphaproteobacteria bacterium]|nr:DUF4239 domain-containing protein [Alphaproteobacteria bacterium]
MLTNWIYSQPNWIIGIGVVALIVFFACTGLFAFDRLVPVKLRRAHNDVVGFSIAVTGVIYAVLLAFIAVATWETFRKADNAVAAEANYIGDVYRNTLGAPDALAVPLREHLNRYIEVVIAQEWPAQQEGRLEEPSWREGWKILADFHYDLGRFRPANAGEAVLQAQLLRSLNSLYDARRTRLLAAREHVTPVVWWIVGLGAMITISFTFLFGALNLKMHMAVTAMVAASLAVVIVLIVVLDYPFRGALSVSNEAFHEVRQNMETLTFQHR